MIGCLLFAFDNCSNSRQISRSSWDFFEKAVKKIYDAILEDLDKQVEARIEQIN